jgi:NAD(P)-dependent dehydrogenase (short-subunit alcohol dehydrogenase family)
VAGRADGRRAIFVTGAASGMGLETARLFAREGWFVGGFDVNEAGLERLADDIGRETCLVRRLDVTDLEDYRAAITAFGAATDGRMDVLFNNAGIGRGGPFADQSLDDIMAVVNVNFVGVLHGIHLALPLLRATPDALCFTTSSSSATYGMPGIAVYSATKHAVKGLTEALAVEFKAYGIRAADVLPGLIDTPILPEGIAAAAPKEGMFRAIPPVEVAKVVWRAVTEDVLHWYVPEEIAELGRQATLEPEATRDRIATGSMFHQVQEEPA